MKKIIIAIIITALFPISAFAITPGYGGNIQCQVWREGMPTAGTTGAPVYCNDLQDLYKRTYELEQLTNQLRSQNDALQQKVNSQSGATVQPTQTIVQTKETIVRDPDNTKVDALEKRVSALETAVTFIQTKIMAAIQTTIDLLKKLLK
jgi:hypothetical protein